MPSFFLLESCVNSFLWLLHDPEPSKLYHMDPDWPSVSTGTVADPRIVLFHIISQSYMVTLTYSNEMLHIWTIRKTQKHIYVLKEGLFPALSGSTHGLGPARKPDRYYYISILI